MKDANDLRNLLAEHTGSQQIFRHSLVGSFNYTEGVRAFFQNAGQGAYWLGDILATEPKITRAVRGHGFCLAVLEVQGKGAKLTVAKDASEQRDMEDQVVGYTFQDIAYTHAIDYTDCPEGFWKLYLTHSEVGSKTVVLALLPSEY